MVRIGGFPICSRLGDEAFVPVVMRSPGGSIVIALPEGEQIEEAVVRIKGSP